MTAKNKALPIIHEARTGNTVETMDITAGFVAEGKPFMAVSAAFMAAQDALSISLKWDRASNRGWVTTAEAAAIRKHMAANV